MKIILRKPSYQYSNRSREFTGTAVEQGTSPAREALDTLRAALRKGKPATVVGPGAEVWCRGFDLNRVVFLHWASPYLPVKGGSVSPAGLLWESRAAHVAGTQERWFPWRLVPFWRTKVLEDGGMAQRLRRTKAREHKPENPLSLF